MRPCALPAATQATLLGSRFFPSMIATPFIDGLREACTVSAAMILVGAAASLLRGQEHPGGAEARPAASAGARQTGVAAGGARYIPVAGARPGLRRLHR